MNDTIPMPVATRCQNCGHVGAEFICAICKVEKTVQAQGFVECRYYRGHKCDCQGRGFCLDAA